MNNCSRSHDRAYASNIQSRLYMVCAVHTCWVQSKRARKSRRRLQMTPRLRGAFVISRCCGLYIYAAAAEGERFSLSLVSSFNSQIIRLPSLIMSNGPPRSPLFCRYLYSIHLFRGCCVRRSCLYDAKRRKKNEALRHVTVDYRCIYVRARLTIICHWAMLGISKQPICFITRMFPKKLELYKRNVYNMMHRKNTANFT